MHIRFKINFVKLLPMVSKLKKEYFHAEIEKLRNE